MKRRISIFLPTSSIFHQRIFRFLNDSFSRHGFEVSGDCRLLDADEMNVWLKEYKPDVVFEMNRVKDEIPLLHDLDVKHISWVVDMQGRSESQIRGSEITYTFDPNWEFHFQTGGHTEWLPPGVCTDSFYFDSKTIKDVDFSFIGHIPYPWRDFELSRKICYRGREIYFSELLASYIDYMGKVSYKQHNHEKCVTVIDDILEERLGEAVKLPKDMYYDLLVRIKRMSNRTELIDFVLERSKSLTIHGSENWKFWPKYCQYYSGFIDSTEQMRQLFIKSRVNLHDGVGFHFRSIDCLASGGVLFWYDDNGGDRFDEIPVATNTIPRRGLHSFFEPQRHYFEFRWDSFDAAYEMACERSNQTCKIRQEVSEIINNAHTWDCRVKKVINDFKLL